MHDFYKLSQLRCNLEKDKLLPGVWQEINRLQTRIPMKNASSDHEDEDSLNVHYTSPSENANAMRCS